MRHRRTKPFSPVTPARPAVVVSCPLYERLERYAKEHRIPKAEVIRLAVARIARAA